MALHLPFLAGIALGCAGVVAFNNRAKIKEKIENGLKCSNECDENECCKAKEFVKDNFDKAKDFVEEGFEKVKDVAKRGKSAVDALKANSQEVTKDITNEAVEPVKKKRIRRTREQIEADEKAKKPKRTRRARTPKVVIENTEVQTEVTPVNEEA